MYKIIGADGRQYGPVSADAIREWIAAGRANAQTQAQAEGATEWQPLSAIAEFAEALASASVATPAPAPETAAGLAAPSAALMALPPNPQLLAEEVLQREYTLDITGCLQRGWEKLQTDFWPIVGISALVWLLIGAANSAYIGLLLTGPLLGGLYHYYLKLIRGEHAEISDAFVGFSQRFLPLMLVSLVSGLLTLIGFFLCIIPGIYLGVAWQLAVPLAMDRQLEFWDAMEVSRKVITKHWWSFFGLVLLSILLNFAGALVCCVGMFVTLPITSLALMYAYEDVFRAGKS